MNRENSSRDQAHSLRIQRREDYTFSSQSDNQNRARRITVTSGKGGVGKSNISLNLAIAYGRLKKRVLLIDADTNLANIDILLGLHIRQSLADVVLGDAFFSDVMVNGPEGIKILPGSSGIIEMVERDSTVRDKLLTAFEEFERIYDIIVIDTGAGLSENVLAFILGADDVVLVTNSEPTSITDAYAMVKVAIQQNPAVKIHVIVNLAVNRAQAEETFEKLQLAVRNFLQAEISMLGFLPVDPNIPVAVGKQEPFTSLFPRSTATNSLMMMARKLLKISIPDPNRVNFLAKIFHTKRI